MHGNTAKHNYQQLADWNSHIYDSCALIQLTNEI